MLFEVRKIVTIVEEIFHDHSSGVNGPIPATPAMKGAVAAVVTNPYVGKYIDDLSPAVDELRALGERLGNILIGHLGGDASKIDGYGKGIIVGSAGEIEHGAMWHIPGGGGMRAALGKGTSIVPSTKKVAGMEHVLMCRSRIWIGVMWAVITTPLKWVFPMDLSPMRWW